MKKQVLFAFVAGALALAGCAKDQELYDKVDDLTNRVTTLEEQVKEINEKTIPGMQALVVALQGNIYVTSVKQEADGYTIVFSNNTTAYIQNGKNGENGENGLDGVDGKKGETGDKPVIGVIEIKGEWYWTVDGQILKGPDGKAVPVHREQPYFRINGDGLWEVSYNGEDWAIVPSMGSASGADIEIKDEDTCVTFYINGKPYVIQKEVPFYLVFQQRTDLGVVEGATTGIEYTIQGADDSDEIEVDILNATNGWEAKVVSLPNGENPGYITVTNTESKDGKVFVYASNGKGKTDIKSLSFEEGVLQSVVDAQTVSCNGGKVILSVTTNMEYDIYIQANQTWLTLAETKATHTDVITLEAKANETASFRAAAVDVIEPNSGNTEEFVIVQYPSDALTTELSSVDNVADGTEVSINAVTVLATSRTSAIVSDGTTNLYTTGKYLPVGKKINIAGTKKTTEDENEINVIEVSSYQTVAETSDFTVGSPLYYGVAINQAPSYTGVTGTLTREDGTVKVTYNYSDKYGDVKYVFVLENPIDALVLDGFEDNSTVTVTGYTTTCAEESGDETIVTTNLIAVNVKDATLKVNASWAISYSESDNSSYPERITNTVTGTTCNYTLSVYSAEKIEEAGGIEAFVADNYLSVADELQYDLRYYQSYGYSWDYLYALFVHSGTGYDDFSTLDYGKYVALAVGVDATANATGDYQYLEFEKVDPYCPAKYEDYLGNWTINGSTVTISEDVNGESYKVTGFIKSSDVGLDASTVEALYDDEEECMYINEQITGTYSETKYGSGPIYLSGMFTYSGKQFSAYPSNSSTPNVLTKVKMNSDGTIEFTAGTCKFGVFDGYRTLWEIVEGDYAGQIYYMSSIVEFPFTGEKQGEPTEDYLSWMGNYTINTKSVKTGADTTYAVTLYQSIPNSTIAIDGLGIDGVPLNWEKTSNTLTACFGKFGSNSTFDFYVSGITNENYISTGDATRNNAIAIFSKNENGSINIESAVYDISEERKGVHAIYWGIFGKKISASTWHGFSDVNYIVTPATMTASSTTAAVSSFQGKVDSTVKYETIMTKTAAVQAVCPKKESKSISSAIARRIELN